MDRWPALGRLPDAPQPPALHAEIERRHGMIDLLDVLKEADHPSGFTRRLLSVASREITDADTARRRKLLVSFALGSNIGISGSPTRLKGIPTTPRRRRAGSGGSTSPARTSAPRSSDR